MKTKQKLVTMNEYCKNIDRISKMKLQVHETLIKMLEYAATVKIKKTR